MARLGAGPAEAQAGAGWMGAAVPFAGSSSPHWKGARGCPPPRSAWSWGAREAPRRGVWSGSSVVWLPQALSFHLPLAFPCLLSPPSGPCLPRIADRPHPNSSQTLSAAQSHRRHLEPCPGGPWDRTGNSLLARASVGAGSGQTDEAANVAGRAVRGDLSPVGLPRRPPPRWLRPLAHRGPAGARGQEWTQAPSVSWAGTSRPVSCSPASVTSPACWAPTGPGGSWERPGKDTKKPLCAPPKYTTSLPYGQRAGKAWSLLRESQ